MNEREEARLRLQESVDNLGQEASLQVRMQREPLKMLGIATGVGAVIGILLGRSFKKTKKVYVDDTLSKKERKAFAKAQERYKGPVGNIGGALLATLGTLAFKIVQDRFIVPKLEELAQNLNSQAGQPGTPRKPNKPRPSKDVVIRDFRAPAEKAHADAQGNLHVAPALQTAGQVAFAARDVPVRDFRDPAEKAHATPQGSILSESPLPESKLIEAEKAMEGSTAAVKPNLEK
ncbi:hypothetical protein [Deinococcus sp.]|uniref:hypothetical protein n=1 Tax=Deinococcus sp. TaxID=47478 RepID=UPI003B590DCD